MTISLVLERFLRAFMTSTAFSSSNAPVGSSAKMMSGSLANALAIATLSFSPPDNDDGNCLANLLMLNSTINCLMRRRSCLLGFNDCFNSAS